MTPRDPGGRAGGTCPFCGLAYPGSPNQCSRCGTLLGEAADDLKRLGAQERGRIRSRKALADTLFLVGLLLGGPMITLGHNVLLGGFVVLAGGTASVLRRYTEWSTPGVVAIASLLAAVVASAILEPAHQAMDETLATEGARQAYVDALNGQNADVLVEGRGAGVVAVWFTVPREMAGACGSYPGREVRTHLADLGFLRVVVSDRNAVGGLCSFAP